MRDLLDIHVLGEWKNTRTTLMPTFRTEDPNPISPGHVLVELGRSEAEINDKVAKVWMKNGLVAPGGPATNSVLMSVLVNPDQIDLNFVTVDGWNAAIRRIKRAQNNLLKCHLPGSILAESYRHEILLTSELLLLASRIGRSLVVEGREATANDSSEDDSSRPNIGIANLPSTFRTDTANK